MSRPVERFRPSVMRGGKMLPDPDGEFVRYEDYIALKAELDALRDGFGPDVRPQGHDQDWVIAKWSDGGMCPTNIKSVCRAINRIEGGAVHEDDRPILTRWWEVRCE